MHSNHKNNFQIKFSNHESSAKRIAYARFACDGPLEMSWLRCLTLNDIVVQYIELHVCLEKVVMCIALMCDDLTVHQACRKQ